MKHETGGVSPEVAVGTGLPDGPCIPPSPEHSEKVPTETEIVPTETNIVPTETEIVPTETKIVPTETERAPTEIMEAPAQVEQDEAAVPPIGDDGSNGKGTEESKVDEVEEPIIEIKDEVPDPDDPDLPEPPVVSRKSQFEMKNAEGDGRGRGRGRGKGRGGRKGKGRGGRKGKGRGKGKPVLIEDSDDEKPAPSKPKRSRRSAAKAKAGTKKGVENAGQEQDGNNEHEAQETKIVWGPVTKTGKDGFERLLQPQAPPPGSDVPEPTEVPEPPQVPEPTQLQEPQRKRAKIGESIHGPSFARRPCPKTSPSKHRWNVIKSSYSFLGSLVVEMGYNWGSHEVGNFLGRLLRSIGFLCERTTVN